MKKIIVTTGPSVINGDFLLSLHRDQYIYRINGSHGDMSGLEEYINTIRRQIPDARILLDLPGNKVRVANLDEPITLRKGERFLLKSTQVNYDAFGNHLKKGDIVWANDSIYKFTIDSVGADSITFLSQSDGILINGKGLHVRGIHENIPFLFDKDMELIELANRYKLNYIGLSFVRNAEDICLAKKYIDAGIEIISKVETRSAVDNLQEILGEVETVILDRGDLSTEVGLEKIPAYQRYIIDKVLFYNKRIFVATQFLKSMEDKPIPVIAEVVDMYNTFKCGVHGIQLSEEIAVGKYPKECLDVVNSIINEIDSEIK